MIADFDRAWAFIQRWEGGGLYHHDPDDPGGATKWGISQRAFPTEDIRALTEDRAKELFREHYWDPCWCGELPSPLAIALVDAAFNAGRNAAVGALQRALGVVSDGKMGPATLAAAARVGNMRETLRDFLAERAIHYARLNSKYHRGWFRRLIAMAQETAA